MSIKESGAVADSAVEHEYYSVALTDDQKAVSCADFGDRILVEAGPGTGKTETVAHRLVNLIEQGLRPPQILVLSFSRSAVKTLANRIERMQHHAARHVEELRYLSVRTFDSWTFKVLRQLNFQPGDLLRRDYETNIHELITQLRGDNRSLLKQLLQDIKHVIVDEFQDLSGVRGALVTELLTTLSPPGRTGSGFTVLGDPAQAIYGFALRDGLEDYRALTSGALVEKLRNLYDGDVELLQLGRNFRAQGELESIVAKLRKLLLLEASARSKFKSMVTLTNHVAELEGELRPEVLLRPDVGSAAILTATNGESIRVAQSLLKNADPADAALIRLHAGSQPAIVPAWVGATLGRMKDTSLPKSQFKRIYDHLYVREGHALVDALGVPSFETAWERLARATGDTPDATSVDLKVLCSRIGWPDLLPDDDGVKKAAIHVMTIHQSKGMEFDAVAIMTDSLGQRQLTTEAENLEAANVIFVGMTRAAKNLFRVGEGKTFSALSPRKFNGGRRRWLSWRHGWVNIETGIPGDVDAVGFIDRRVFGEEGILAPDSAIADNQDYLATNANSLRGRKVVLCKWPVPGEKAKYVYRIHLEESGEAGRVLGVTTKNLTCDLLDLIWSKGYSLPTKLFDLRISDVVTIGLHQELPASSSQPWATSCICVGINIYGTGNFKVFKRR